MELTTAYGGGGLPSLGLPPKLPSRPVVGFLADFRRDAPALFVKAVAQGGDICRLRIGPQVITLLNRPDMVAHVLQYRASNYARSSSYDQLRLLLGGGLLTAEGESWKRGRAHMQPAFRHRALASLPPLMAVTALDLLGRKEEEFCSGRPVDAFGLALETSMQISGRTLFDADLSAEAAGLAAALQTAVEYITRRFEAMVRLPAFVPVPEQRRFRAAVSDIDRVIYAILEGQRRRPEERTAIMAEMIRAASADDGAENVEVGHALRDDLVTLFLTSFETTATALAWTLFFLSRHPDVRTRVEAEIDAVVGEGIPDQDALDRMVYLAATIRESLRLYPPVWSFSRKALSDDVIGGYRIPRGSMVVVSPYTLHRRPDLWPNPEGFDPSRFLPGSTPPAHHAYFPFGMGPRVCIGNHFALIELQTVLAVMLARWRFDLLPGQRGDYKAGITICPRNKIRMAVSRR